jgi:hypothetical protein
MDYQTQKVITAEANAEGECYADVSETIEGKLVIERKHYFKIEELYGEVCNFDLHNYECLEYPMIQKPRNDDEIKLMIQPNNKKNCLRLHVINPDGQEITDTTESIMIENDEQRMHYSIQIRKTPRIALH